MAETELGRGKQGQVHKPTHTSRSKTKLRHDSVLARVNLPHNVSGMLGRDCCFTLRIILSGNQYGECEKQQQKIHTLEH